MKKFHPHLNQIVLVVLVAVACGCSRKDTTALQEQTLDQGRELSQVFMGSLKVRLVTALEQGGPVEAIEVCHRDAAAMADQVSASHPGVLGVKRISPRWRNSSNQPDELDRAAWRLFETSLPVGPDEAEDLLVPDPVQEDHLVYYRALRMAPLCLTCHGPVDDIPADVRTALAQRYPDDRATGFQAGELRGLIRIDFKSEKLAETD